MPCRPSNVSKANPRVTHGYNLEFLHTTLANAVSFTKAGSEAMSRGIFAKEIVRRMKEFSLTYEGEKGRGNVFSAWTAFSINVLSNATRNRYSPVRGRRCTLHSTLGLLLASGSRFEPRFE
jgi:hypothetical protein